MTMQYTIKELRQFAFIMAAMIILLFGLLFPWLYGWGFTTTPYIISVVFVAVALIAPRVLSPVFYGWTKFSHVLGYINSKLLLFIVFYLIIAPMGLVAKLFGFDPMNKKTEADSHYIQRDNDDNNMENPF